MARERQECDWVRAAVPAAWIINRNGWTKAPVEPAALIPAPLRPAPPPAPALTPAERAAESRRAWHLLDTFFGGA